MDSVTPWLEALFRWVHVVAGVTWIGLLYFFNWINGNVGKQLDGETKQKVLPELLPRTLYFFRWGAAYTWVTGVLLLGLIYYMGAGPGIMGVKEGTEGVPATGAYNVYLAFALVLVGAGIYDILWKVLQDKKEIALGISFILLLGVMSVLDNVFALSARGVYIHVGALFGTCMAMNVWMRIWPAQRKIITAIKAGEKPDAAWGALAGLRSKHNTYMSVPLIYMMLNEHTIAGFPTSIPYLWEEMPAWVGLAIVTAVGWLFTYWVYKKSKTDAPASY